MTAGIVVATPEEMVALGRRLAGLLRAGDVVLLAGGLGAGKTTLTRGIGAGLGVRGAVTSPTFVIARVHPSGSEAASPPLVHVDAYRLSGWDELEDLDLETSLAESVTVVEWGEGLAEGLAPERLEVRLDRSPSADDEVRLVQLAGIGARWEGIDAELAVDPKPAVGPELAANPQLP